MASVLCHSSTRIRRHLLWGNSAGAIRPWRRQQGQPPSQSSSASSRVRRNSFPTMMQRSFISTTSTADAKRLLGFLPTDRPTIPELRAAYFQAAKKTHPDAVANNDDDSTKNRYHDFCRVTEAYECLLQSREVSTSSTSNKFQISTQEEDEYRSACMAVLGVPAEIVEESKGNPMFRHWLGGNTDGAQHWRAFFAVHGGLAQKLAKPVAYLGTGGRQLSSSTAALESRRKRKK